MLELNREIYLDKLHACWLGKNIGGTMGAPYEGSRELLDIDGFKTKRGEPLPNDDLDLQLVWLNAVEHVGPKHVSANVLAEYWLDWICPHWNEYGVAKTNLRMGLLPPVSGEIDNEKWKNSNGAWIRSEIWAGLAPGAVDAAVRYAVMDASVDHGVAEGTCAEIFTAAMQSAAYFESDRRVLLETALTKIPVDSMIAQTVRLVMDCYDRGVDYKEAREQVVAFNKELGWFQAPGNLGFVAIGLLYGEGDFKRSLIYAINCADDTDCTAATVGATLGIIGGTAAIPEELKSFVGDRIITLSINGMYGNMYIPKTCTELTQRIAALVPAVMAANGVDFRFTEEAAAVDEKTIRSLSRMTAKDFLERSPYSYDITGCRIFSVRVEMDQSPRIAPLDERRIRLTFFCNPEIQETRKLHFRLLLPDGWSAAGFGRTLTLPYPQPIHGIFGVESMSFTLQAGETVEPVMRAYVEVTTHTHPVPVMIPLVFIG